MSDADDLQFDPAQFAGQARLFPLPNLVLLPHVLQPLHIFEPRYRALLEDAVAGDRLIAMSLLAPGWERDYDGRPPLEPIACLGRVATWQQVDAERYNLLLLGLRRVRLERELPPLALFRRAQVEVLEDDYPQSGAEARPALYRQLADAFRPLLPKLTGVGDQLEPLLGGNVPLGVLTDIVAYSLPLAHAIKALLLAELNVDARAKILVQELAHAQRAGAALPALKYPLDFSDN